MIFMQKSGWKFCPDCGAKVVEPGLFCANCGRRLTKISKAKQLQQEEQKGNVCSKCGAPLDNWGYCNNCRGYSL
jgi:predicted amidophosphoribosyltransferase